MTDRDTQHYTTGIEERELEECVKMTGFAWRSQICTFEKMTLQISTLKKKETKKHKLLGRESNPSLLCDRQGYSPLHLYNWGFEEC